MWPEQVSGVVMRTEVRRTEARKNRSSKQPRNPEQRMAFENGRVVKVFFVWSRLS
jgi:hypothetical protein